MKQLLLAKHRHPASAPPILHSWNAYISSRGALLIAFVLLETTSVLAEVNAPNLVIFLVGDMGLMDTSVPMLTTSAGQPKRYPWNDWYRTPNMERLAANGVRFSNVYS